jgi:hypothetical protein
MTFSLGWQKRDEEGTKVRIEFSLVRDKISWQAQHGRHTSRAPYDPIDEDWEQLFETMDRHLARGKVSHTDYKIVKKLHRDGFL